MGNEPRDEVGEALHRARGSLTPSTLPFVIAVFAALGYGVLHLAAEEFYGPFGVSPEDAGLDRVTLLVRSTIFVGFIGAAVLALFTVSTVIVRAIGRTQWARRRSVRPRPVWQAMTLLSGSFILSVVWIWLAEAPDDSRQVRLGYALTREFRGIPVYPYRATVADLHWRQSERGSLTHIQCALVIGSTSGYSLVYAPGVGTFRVTPDQALVVLHPQSDSHCPVR